MKFVLAERKFSFDGEQLKRDRLAASMSQQSFADACGWSRWYQQRLELKGTRTLSESTCRVIHGLLLQRGVLSEIET